MINRIDFYLKTVKALTLKKLIELCDKLLPPENKDRDEPYEELLASLKKCGIHRAYQLKQIVGDNLCFALDLDMEAIRSGKGRKSVSRPDRLVYHTHVGLIRMCCSRRHPQIINVS